PSPATADALRRAETDLLSALLAAEPVEPPAALGPAHATLPGRWRAEAAQCGRLVLISPNPVSLYSVAVLELCLRHGLPVAAILVRSFSLQRLAQEYKRDGLRLPRKVWRKLVLRADENAVTDGVSMKATVDALAPRHRDIRRTARAHGIPLLSIDGFVGCGAALRRLAPDLGLFTGGGMVDADTIAAFSRGVINVHLGQLPHYKGMDVVQAPLLEARRTLGASAHLMVPQLDAGPVLLRTDADAFAFTSLGALRNSLACMLPFMLVDAALGLCSGRLDPLDQPPAGRQFFITHPRLQAIIDALLKRRGGQSPSSAGSLEQRVGAALAAVGPGR
ncbi:MAG: formyltransferase family protein, partial [Sphingomicrobium sp.]